MNTRKPIHPGEVLQQDVIEPLGISITEAAKCLGVSQETLAALLNTNSSVTPEMAVRIGKAHEPAQKVGFRCKLNMTYG